MKRTVQNVQVEEPKIVEEARNKQKEKRNEALEKVSHFKGSVLGLKILETIIFCTNNIFIKYFLEQ